MEFEPDSFDSFRKYNRLEIKAANGGLPESLWETYSSFANTYGAVSYAEWQKDRMEVGKQQA